ncbi:MAG: M23 family metallopeptidase [Desulfovibrionales bacterium]
MKRNRYTLHQQPTSLRRKFLQIVLILGGLLLLLLIFDLTVSKMPPSLSGKEFSTGTISQVPSESQEPSEAPAVEEQEPEEAELPQEPEPGGSLEQVVQVAHGDTLIDLLLQAGVTNEEAHAALSALREVYNPRGLRPGQEVVLTFQPLPGEEEAKVFVGLKLQADVDCNVLVRKQEPEQLFMAAEERWELHHGVSAAEGIIETSLYEAALQNNLPLPALMQMVRAYSFDIDFQRDIHPGDRFQVLYERQTDDNGTILRVGPVLYASLETRGKTVKLFRYTALDGEVDYFDEKGSSVRKSLMLTPIDGARLSSGYGMRRHPILGYNRMHRGLDFAAPSGTPIMAAGNGVVTHVGRKGDYGKTVIIRHSGGYTTLYAHMKGFARGIKTGVRVTQGQTIGYVGNTGMSTGPHLHYEVKLNKRFVNPSRISSTPGRVLAGKDLERFMDVKEGLEQQYASACREKVVTVP